MLEFDNLDDFEQAAMELGLLLSSSPLTVKIPFVRIFAETIDGLIYGVYSIRNPYQSSPKGFLYTERLEAYQNQHAIEPFKIDQGPNEV